MFYFNFTKIFFFVSNICWRQFSVKRYEITKLWRVLPPPPHSAPPPPLTTAGCHTTPIHSSDHWPLQAAIQHQIPLLSLQSQTIETKWKEYLNFAPVLYTNSVCSVTKKIYLRDIWLCSKWKKLQKSFIWHKS